MEDDNVVKRKKKNYFIFTWNQELVTAIGAFAKEFQASKPHFW